MRSRIYFQKPMLLILRVSLVWVLAVDHCAQAQNHDLDSSGSVIDYQCSYTNDPKGGLVTISMGDKDKLLRGFVKYRNGTVTQIAGILSDGVSLDQLRQDKEARQVIQYGKGTVVDPPDYSPYRQVKQTFQEGILDQVKQLSSPGNPSPILRMSRCGVSIEAKGCCAVQLYVSQAVFEKCTSEERDASLKDGTDDPTYVVINNPSNTNKLFSTIAEHFPALAAPPSRQPNRPPELGNPKLSRPGEHPGLRLGDKVGAPLGSLIDVDDKIFPFDALFDSSENIRQLQYQKKDKNAVWATINQSTHTSDDPVFGDLSARLASVKNAVGCCLNKSNSICSTSSHAPSSSVSVSGEKVKPVAPSSSASDDSLGAAGMSPFSNLHVVPAEQNAPAK